MCEKTHSVGTYSVARELQRWQHFNSLRQYFEEALRNKLKIPPPREALNRWLFSRDDDALKEEILDDLPVKIQRFGLREDRSFLEQVLAWKAAMRDWIRREALQEISEKDLNFIYSDECPSTADSHGNDCISDVTHDFHHSRTGDANDSTEDQHGNSLSEAVELEPLAAKKRRTEHVSKEYITIVELRLMAKRILGPSVQAVLSEIVNDARSRLDAILNPVLSSIAHYSVTADYDLDRKLYALSATSEDAANASITTFKISEWAHNKLAELFIAELSPNTFYEELFCCCCRYDALCGKLVRMDKEHTDGPNQQVATEGAGLQAALPQEVFDELLPRIDFECFASPFNVSRLVACGRFPNKAFFEVNSVAFCGNHPENGETHTEDLVRKYKKWKNSAYRPYCSFFDEDRVFGSFGSFFKLADRIDRIAIAPLEGFFECNPPFDIVVMKKLTDVILAWLDKSQIGGKRLAFLLILPEWRSGTASDLDTSCTSPRDSSPVDLLLACRFLSATIVRSPEEHHYLKGRCWDWSRSSIGPPKAFGISASRAILLQSLVDRTEGERIMSQLRERW